MTENIYVYAILFAPENDLDLPEGIEGEVELISNSKIAAIIEKNISLEDLQKTEETLLKSVVAHDRVIQAVFQQVSLLPLRFGTGFTSVASLLANLDSNQEQYCQQLNYLRGKVEYGIKFIPLEFKADEGNNTQLKGKNYLLAKKKNYQLQQQFTLEQEAQWETIKASAIRELGDRIFVKEQEDLKQIFLLQEQKNNPDDLIDTWIELGFHWHIAIGEPLPCYHFTA